MMAKKTSALAGIFDDEPATTASEQANPLLAQELVPVSQKQQHTVPAQRRASHPGKKPVLIHIPADMHRALRQLSVEEGGEPLTVVTERLLRQYLVKKGHTRFASK